MSPHNSPYFFGFVEKEKQAKKLGKKRNLLSYEKTVLYFKKKGKNKTQYKSTPGEHILSAAPIYINFHTAFFRLPLLFLCTEACLAKLVKASRF